MPFYHRKNQYLSILEEVNELSVSDLAKKLFISEPTVRRDLAILEKEELIIRTHGGVKLNNRGAYEFTPLLLREKNQNTAKAIMGKKAASLIHDGYTIMMDASTSALNILPYIVNVKNLFVITSGVKTSYLLSKMKINHICSGGMTMSNLFSYVGSDAERTIRNYTADIAFFSCRGLSLDGKATDTSIEENNIRRVMIENSARKVLLCDSSKINKIYLNILCTVEDVDEIICEAPLPPQLQNLLAKKTKKPANNKI